MSLTIFWRFSSQNAAHKAQAALILEAKNGSTAISAPAEHKPAPAESVYSARWRSDA